MVKVEPIVKTTTVTEGFKVELSAAQLLYIVAVIGATVASGTIPPESQGLYSALAKPLEEAGLLCTDLDVPEGKTTNEDGVPYATVLFEHMGLKSFAR